jgi:hypothetical protein
MAKSSSLESLLASLLDQLAARIASRIGATVKAPKSAPAAAAKGKPSRRKGKTLDMTCRVAGCKNRSRGPRFGFICDEHRNKLSKKDQQAARIAWNERKKAA